MAVVATLLALRECTTILQWELVRAVSMRVGLVWIAQHAQVVVNPVTIEYLTTLHWSACLCLDSTRVGRRWQPDVLRLAHLVSLQPSAQPAKKATSFYLLLVRCRGRTIQPCSLALSHYL